MVVAFYFVGNYCLLHMNWWTNSNFINEHKILNCKWINEWMINVVCASHSLPSKLDDIETNTTNNNNNSHWIEEIMPSSNLIGLRFYHFLHNTIVYNNTPCSAHISHHMRIKFNDRFFPIVTILLRIE